MTSDEIRTKFIEYFQEHGHLRVTSSSLIPDEPTLLLTTAGMVQMMPYLLSQKKPPHVRVCSVQKCFRTTDIDEVGNDGRHLTFFEMLGSWSFGDYYKKDAIKLAYDLLVDKFHFDKEKMWVSVFKGENGIPRDEESIKYWEEVGVPKDRIVELGWGDNFWGPPGNEGPCGPSTEVYYDMLSDELKGVDTNLEYTHMNSDKIYQDLTKRCLPGCDCDRFLEVWNAGVFTEYYRDANKVFTPLPQKNVDTGAGLERMASFLQGKRDVFHTDMLFPIYKGVEGMMPKETPVKSIRIITDHIRAAVFLIADEVYPSNEHRGYVLRKILRRAIVQVLLNDGEFPFLEKLVDIVINLFKDEYPNLLNRREKIIDVISQEEQKFSNSLKRAITQMDKILEKKKNLDGKDVFLLKDTYGLPVEVLKDIFIEKGLEFDSEGYEREMDIQRERSRSSSSFKTRD